MKGLFVLHQREGRRAVAEAQIRLATQCQALGWAWDTYFYGEGDLCAFAADCDLRGTVYVQQATDLTAVAGEIGRLLEENGYDGIFLADGCQSQHLSVRLGQQKGLPFLNGVTAMDWDGQALHCEKMVYNHYFLGRYVLPAPFVVQEKLPYPRQPAALPGVLTCIERAAAPAPAHIRQAALLEQAGEHAVSPVLFVAGMGVGEKRDVERIRAFCQENGFDFGVTRPVAMRGWGSMDELIGVSGRICAPKVTITLGVSGSAAFLAGIEQSEYIVAVNVSPKASLVAQCDALIEDDYAKVLDELFERLRAYRRT